MAEGGSKAPEDILTDCRSELIKRIELTETLWSELLTRKVLTTDVREKIQYNRPPTEQVGALLDYIAQKRPERDSNSFCEALICSNQGHIVQTYLKPNAGASPSMSKSPAFQSGKWAGLPQCVQRYRTSLRAHHIMHLSKLKRELPVKHDIKNYVKLILFSRKSGIEERRGFMEHHVSHEMHSNPIKPTELFQPYQDEPAPHAVLLLGSPGAGKTATAYHFLDRHIHDELWQDQFAFVLFIPLREVNIPFQDEDYFQRLLFKGYVPQKDQKQVWDYIEEHPEKLLIILDGYDEMDDRRFGKKIECPREKAEIKIIILNIIERNLLPASRLLITSRFHCIKDLQKNMNRIVELAGFSLKDLQELVYNKIGPESDTLAQKVMEYILKHENILSLCGTPVNAVGFVEYIAWRAKGQKDFIPEKILPATRASLMWLLIVNLLTEHDRGNSDQEECTDEEIVSARAPTLRKLSQLAYAAYTNGRKLVFNDNDLKKYGLTKEEVVNSGLMSGQITQMQSNYKCFNKLLFSFLHQTYQEQLAAVYFVKVSRSGPDSKNNLKALAKS